MNRIATRLRSFWWWAEHDLRLTFMCPSGKHATRDPSTGPQWCRWCIEPMNAEALQQEERDRNTREEE